MKQNNKNKIVRFLCAQTISLLGSSIVQYGMIWYITLTTTSGVMLAISTLCGFLPQIAIALFAGKWIDTYDAKKVVMISDGCIAGATFVLAVCFLLKQESLVLVFIVLAIRSLGTGMQMPCVNTLIPQICESDQLVRINGINSTLSAITSFVAPMLSGMLLSITTLPALLMIDVITAIIAIGITSTIRIAGKTKREKQVDVSAHKKQTWQFIKQNKYLGYLFLFQFMIYFFITPAAFLTPLMVARRFGKEVWRLSMSEMSYSLGMVLGGVLITLWGGFQKRTKTMVVASVMYGLLMVMLGSLDIFWLYLIANVSIGVITPCYGTSFTVYVQEQVEKTFHGRIFSLMQIANSCAFPIGMCVFGPIADYIAIEMLLCICGLVVIVTTILLRKKISV